MVSMAQPHSVRSSIALFLATAGLMTVTTGCGKPPAEMEGGEGKPALTTPADKEAGGSANPEGKGSPSQSGQDQEGGEGGEGGEG